jgi:hypothetical protein
VAVSNAIASPGYLMSGGTRLSEMTLSEFKTLSEIETTKVDLGRGRQASIRPCVFGAQQAAAQISPKHVRIMTNVVTNALTGIPPSAQERRT